MKQAANALLLCIALPTPLLAQERPPALMVKPPQRGGQAGPSRSLGLSEVEVQARVFGFLAETTMTMTFHNPHNRVLEGTLYFPLPEGSTVSGYALDVNGVMVDGVVVEKEKARVVFEKEVRKGVDPGLVEWVKGNNFKTRVYPIPAKGQRTISVTYVAELAIDKGQRLAYQLPLQFKDKLERFLLRLEVVGRGKPDVRWKGPGKLKLNARSGGTFAELSLARKPLTGHLRVALPPVASPAYWVEQPPEEEAYFVINDAPKDPRPRQPPVTSPKRVTLLWDASSSRTGSDLKGEIALVEQIFRRWPKANIDVDLVLFRNAAAKARRFVVKRGQTAALVKALRAVDYDGGTQLASISPLRASKAPDHYLLFSDGLSNFGAEQASGFKAPLYAFSTAPGANHALLRHLARSTGGAYFNLNRSKPAEVAAAIGSQSFSLLSVDVVEGKVIDRLPSGAVPVHGRVTVSGRLRSKRAVLKLSYGIAGKVLKETRVVLEHKGAVRGDLLARFWAQTKLGELVVSPRKNHEAMVALGKRFGLVTPGTSLIVLETLEQYLEHEIAPPTSLRDMHKRYQEQMAQRAAQRKQEEGEKLDAILQMWKERVDWWNTRFTYPKNFRYRDASKKKSRARGGRPADVSGMADMEEASAAEPMAEAREMDDMAPASPGAGPAAAKKEAKADGDDGVQAAISLKAWDPQTPYIKALKAAPAAKRFSVYLAQKKSFGSAPAFFLDCADFFHRNKQVALALQVLSNIAELELESPALLRVLAHRLAQLDLLVLAAPLFEEVLRMRPEEPQSWRDLAGVLARQKKYERAMELLSHVVMNRWDRFDQIEVISLMELNNIIPKARAAGVTKLPVDKRLIKKLDVDVRIVLTWDADMTDMDLWVIEPSGEKAYYGHNRTTIGGLVSRDFTQGYGPEEYVLRKAMHGTYKIQTNFFGSSAQSLSGAVTLQLDLYTNYGRKNEKRKSITVRLTERKETITIGEIEL